MAITLFGQPLSIAHSRNHSGKLIVDVVLTDGADMRKATIDNIPNDNATAVSTLLARSDIQTIFDEGQPWKEDTGINVDSPNKIILDEFPSKAAILAFNDTIDAGNIVVKQKQFNAKITEAIDALIQIQRGR